MWRYIAVVGIMVAITSGQSSNELDVLFDEGKLDNRTIDNMKCSSISGVANGCFECYLCNHNSVEMHRARQHIIQEFQLIDGNCNPTPICCVSQSYLNDYRSNDKCGVDNPEGMPRRVRPNLRSILQGQYPWRAWIYTKGHLLCAATYINEISRALVTSATCLYELTKDDIVVKFDKSRPEESSVEEIIVHPEYNYNNSLNDLAIVILRSLESAPRSAAEACLPLVVPQIGTPCVAASAEDFQINAVIPRQSACNSTSLHPSLMCATTPRNDYSPEIGSGLFCLEEDVNTNSLRHIIYGVVLEQVNDAASIYTNVTNNLNWLKTKINM